MGATQVPAAPPGFGLAGTLDLAAAEATGEAARTGNRVEATRLRKLAEVLRAEARGLRSMGEGVCTERA